MKLLDQLHNLVRLDLSVYRVIDTTSNHHHRHRHRHRRHRHRHRHRLRLRLRRRRRHRHRHYHHHHHHHLFIIIIVVIIICIIWSTELMHITPFLFLFESLFLFHYPHFLLPLFRSTYLCFSVFSSLFHFHTPSVYFSLSL